jgi:hypothetical protein
LKVGIDYEGVYDMKKYYGEDVKDEGLWIEYKNGKTSGTHSWDWKSSKVGEGFINWLKTIFE